MRWIVAMEQNQPMTRVVAAAREYFQNVDEFNYPKVPTSGWPQAPNFAWQQTALHVRQHYKQPWLWWEPDAVPLRRDWLSMIEREYERGRRPLMGHIVAGMGHCNGVAVYPENMPDLSRRAMRATGLAWDSEMRAETINLTHNANHIFAHCFWMGNGCCNNGSGKEPSFPTWQLVQRVVNMRCALFHRCKDGSLQQRLIEKT